MRTSKRVGTLLYTAWIGVLAAAFWQPLAEHWRLAGEEAAQEKVLIASITLEEFETEVEKLTKRINRMTPSEDPLEYARLASAVRELQDRAYKYQYGEPHARPEIGFRFNDALGQVGKLANIRLHELQRLYQEKFGSAVMEEVDRRAEEAPFYVFARERVDVSYAGVLAAWARAYLVSVLFAPFFFIAGLIKRDLRVLVEWWRILLASPAWWAVAPFYPINIDPRAQLKRAMQFAACILSAFISVATTGGLAKAEGSGSKSKRGGYAQIEESGEECSYFFTQGFRSEYLNRPGIRIYKSAFTFSEASAKCGEWDAGVFASMGLGQRDVLKRNFANEIDFYVGWRRRWEERFESYIRLSYFMNDFRGSGIDYARDDQWIVDAEISAPKFPGVAPYIAYRYFGAVGAKSPHPGSFWWIGFKRPHTLRIGPLKLPLRFEGNFAFSDGGLGKNGKDGGFIYGRIIAAFDVALTGTLMLVPSVTWQIADGAQKGGPRDYAERRHTIAYGALIQKKF